MNPHPTVAIVRVNTTSEGLQRAQLIKATQPRAPIILYVRDSSEAFVLQALRIGVANYLRAPCSDHDLLAAVMGAHEGVRSETPNAEGSSAAATTMIGRSAVIRQLRDYIPRVATTDTSVLITGETGVGKELVAELIHAGSPRRHRPCLAVNCAAIPETLLESELFGVERGAFTGAETLREGTLKTADGGTVLFDEVGDMGLSGQAKILRAIETREVRRLGGRTRVPLDVRIIAATNQDLERLTAEGRFRKDLYYRLNVVRIHMPALRDRKEDLPPLVDHYIRYFNARFNRDVEGFTPDAMAHLQQHDWPGNIRELRNLVEAAFVNLNGRRINYVDLPEAFRAGLERTRSLPTDERDRLLSALFATQWNKSKAAQELHWSRMTLYRKLAKYGMSHTKAS
jgi:DNA-binding NtrC family response regulator